MKIIHRWRNFCLLVAVVVALCHFVGTTFAIVSEPAQFGGPITAEMRLPLEKFLRALGADDPEAAINNSRMMILPLNLPDRDTHEGQVLIQVRHGSFCQTMTEGCLTAIGKVSGDSFDAEAMFFAGDRMNVTDTIPRLLGAMTHVISFFSRTLVVSVIRSPQGWIVLPSRRDDRSGQ